VERICPFSVAWFFLEKEDFNVSLTGFPILMVMDKPVKEQQVDFAFFNFTKWLPYRFKLGD
jgi:uncharacterized membrane protein